MRPEGITNSERNDECVRYVAGSRNQSSAHAREVAHSINFELASKKITFRFGGCNGCTRSSMRGRRFVSMAPQESRFELALHLIL